MKIYSYTEVDGNGDPYTFWFSSKAAATKKRNATLRIERKKEKEYRAYDGDFEDLDFNDRLDLDPIQVGAINVHYFTPTKKGLLPLVNSINL